MAEVVRTVARLEVCGRVKPPAQQTSKL